MKSIQENFAQVIGFPNWSALMKSSDEMYRAGNVSFYVTSRSKGDHVFWKSSDPDGVTCYKDYKERYQAEDAAAISYALTFQEPQEQFLTVLSILEAGLSQDHKTGYCNHAGYCELIPVLLEFLQSSKGRKTLELYADWWAEETPTELYSRLAIRKFLSQDWIHEDEIQSWLAAVKTANIEYAVADNNSKK